MITSSQREKQKNYLKQSLNSNIMFIFAMTGRPVRVPNQPFVNYDVSDVEEIEYEDLSDTTDYEPFYN